MYEKRIEYDREARDYRMELGDGNGNFELIGYARSYNEAEVMLDQLVWELLNGAVA